MPCQPQALVWSQTLAEYSDLLRSLTIDIYPGIRVSPIRTSELPLLYSWSFGPSLLYFFEGFWLGIFKFIWTFGNWKILLQNYDFGAIVNLTFQGPGIVRILFGKTKKSSNICFWGRHKSTKFQIAWNCAYFVWKTYVFPSKLWFWGFANLNIKFQDRLELLVFCLENWSFVLQTMILGPSQN